LPEIGKTLGMKGTLPAPQTKKNTNEKETNQETNQENNQ